MDLRHRGDDSTHLVAFEGSYCNDIYDNFSVKRARDEFKAPHVTVLCLCGANLANAILSTNNSESMKKPPTKCFFEAVGEILFCWK